MTMETEAQWQAQWIWGHSTPSSSENNAMQGEEAAETELPRYYYFRHTFAIPEEAQSATLRVCADSRYRLWLNGRLAGHGPARSDPSHQYYDVYEVGERLKAGVNSFAVLATHYGIGTCFSRLGRAGFLLQAEITHADGSVQIIGTDDAWKCAPAPYRTGYPRMSIQLAYPEVFDMRDEPRSWNLTGFDDSAWQKATLIGPIGTSPWTTLAPRDIPLPYYRMIADLRAVQVNMVEKIEEKKRRKEEEETEDKTIHNPQSTIVNSQCLTPAEDMERATRLQPAPPGSVTYKHPALFTVAPQLPSSTPNTQHPTPEHPTPSSTGISVVLDFRREVSGFPNIIVRRSGGGRVDIGYSERIEEDGSVNPNRWGGSEVHYADRLFLRPGQQHYEPLDYRAFRYMRLDFYDNPEPLEVLVEMNLSGYPVQQRGDFQCSDALLQRIWEVGRYTTELCMDDGFMDCPWRERGQWLGDARVEALVAAYAFGDTLLARKALLQYPQSQEATGWFRGVFPSDPPFDAILPTFCMIWPVALWDYFLLTDDRSLLQAVWPNLERLIAAIRRHTDEDGLVADLPGWVFVDWAKVNTKGQSTAVNAMAYDALQHAAKIARAIGYPEKGSDWQMRAHDIKEAVNDLLWDRERQLYSDGIADGERCKTTSEQANVLCALVGIADAPQTERVLKGVFSASDAGLDVRIATPYFAFYLMQLLGKLNRYENVVNYIKTRWRPMLDAGATTFWEQWEPYWSQCHAWSAAPTHTLMASIAGIKPTQPGWEEFDAHLQPCGLSWLRAVVPTPRGDIELAYHYRTRTPHTDPSGSPIPLGATAPAITVNLTVPTGTRASVRIPLTEGHGHTLLDGMENPSITLNGKPIWQAGQPIPPSGDKFQRENDAIVFAIIGGRYHIEIERA